MGCGAAPTPGAIRHGVQGGQLPSVSTVYQNFSDMMRYMMAQLLATSQGLMQDRGQQQQQQRQMARIQFQVVNDDDLIMEMCENCNNDNDNNDDNNKQRGPTVTFNNGQSDGR